MDNALNLRVAAVVQNSGLSILAYSKGADIPQQTLYDAVNSVTVPKANTLSAILKYDPRISAEWLLTGEGSMFKEEQKTDNVQADTNDTRAESGERGADANIEIALLKKEIECLRRENEGLMELIRTMREKSF